jgi:hypothetical protein
MPGGGGGGSPAPVQQSSTTTTVQELSPEQKQLLGLAIPVAEQFVANPPTLFPGPTIAPQNATELAAQQGALDFAQNQLPGITAAPTEGLQFLSSGQALYPETNPALQAATDAAIRPLTQAFQQNILPSIRNDAVSSGQFGSSRQGIAEGIASQSLLQGIGDVSAQVQNEAYQNALDNMTRSLAFAPGVAGLGLLPFDVASQVGAQDRAFEQALLNEQVQRYAAEQLIPFQAAQAAAGLAFGIPGGSTISSSVGTGGQAPGGAPSNFNRTLGGAASGASMGAAAGPWGMLAGGVLGGLAGFLS